MPSGAPRPRSTRSDLRGPSRIANGSSSAAFGSAAIREAAIERTFRRGNFREAQGHHSDICFGSGFAKVSLHTKRIKGLHENDFIMAAKIDRTTSL